MSGYGRRLGAGFVDLFLRGVLLVGLYYGNVSLFLWFMVQQGVTTPQAIQQRLGFLLEQYSFSSKVWVYLMIFGVYDIILGFMESSGFQSSPGKYLFKLKVTDLDGERLSLVRSLSHQTFKSMFVAAPLFLLPTTQEVGWFQLAALGISIVVAILSFAIVFFTPRRQTLADLMLGCYVLDKRVA